MSATYEKTETLGLNLYGDNDPADLRDGYNNSMHIIDNSYQTVVDTANKANQNSQNALDKTQENEQKINDVNTDLNNKIDNTNTELAKKLNTVQHDNTLIGDGTAQAPLKVNHKDSLEYIPSYTPQIWLKATSRLGENQKSSSGILFRNEDDQNCWYYTVHDTTNVYTAYPVVVNLETGEKITNTSLNLGEGKNAIYEKHRNQILVVGDGSKDKWEMWRLNPNTLELEETITNKRNWYAVTQDDNYYWFMGTEDNQKYLYKCTKDLEVLEINPVTLNYIIADIEKIGNYIFVATNYNRRFLVINEKGEHCTNIYFMGIRTDGDIDGLVYYEGNIYITAYFTDRTAALYQLPVKALERETNQETTWYIDFDNDVAINDMYTYGNQKSNSMYAIPNHPYTSPTYDVCGTCPVDKLTFVGNDPAQPRMLSIRGNKNKKAIFKHVICGNNIADIYTDNSDASYLTFSTKLELSNITVGVARYFTAGVVALSNAIANIHHVTAPITCERATHAQIVDCTGTVTGVQIANSHTYIAK